MFIVPPHSTCSGVPEAKEYALWSLSLSISSSNQATIAEAGGVPVLIERVDDELCCWMAAADKATSRSQQAANVGSVVLPSTTVANYGPNAII